MKKLIFFLLCIPLISYAQYGESRYVEIDVVDQYGNSVGTMSMMARHVDTYSNGYEVAVDKYIQYLKEKETREQAEKKFNQLNSRLSNLGMSKVPSWAKGTAVQAASEAMANEREQQNYYNSSSQPQMGLYQYYQQKKLEKQINEAVQREKNQSARILVPLKEGISNYKHLYIETKGEEQKFFAKNFIEFFEEKGIVKPIPFKYIELKYGKWNINRNKLLKDNPEFDSNSILHLVYKKEIVSSTILKETIGIRDFKTNEVYYAWEVINPGEFDSNFNITINGVTVGFAPLIKSKTQKEKKKEKVDDLFNK